jgi:triacylglycerol esterase/lipase EstA (alpha/beta hydrolase family)
MTSGDHEESWAEWDAGGLDDRSVYRVKAFIPHDYASAHARYLVSAAGAPQAYQSREVVVNQEPYYDAWATLGDFCADPFGHIKVHLTDASDGYRTNYIAADAMAFERVPGGQCAHERPVLLLHGFDGDITKNAPGFSVKGYWDKLPAVLNRHGWSNLKYLGFYQDDTRGGANEADITQYTRNGSAPDEYYGSPHCRVLENPAGVGWYGADRNCNIEHLAYNLAWYIYWNYSRHGIDVRIAAHSMGGLIVRHMLQAYSAHNGFFPPTLYVSHVVTLGTPHRGIANAGVLH